MKKLLCLLLVAVMALSLAACGDDKDNGATTTTTTAEETTTEAVVTTEAPKQVDGNYVASVKDGVLVDSNGTPIINVEDKQKFVDDSGKIIAEVKDGKLVDAAGKALATVKDDGSLVGADGKEITTETPTTAAPVSDPTQGNNNDPTQGNDAPTKAPDPVPAGKTNAEIVAAYNAAINKAFDARVGFEKTRSTDNENLDANAAIKMFKNLVYKFMGIGAKNAYTETVAKGQWNEEDTNKHFLRKSTITTSDITGAKYETSGANTVITLNIKGGSSSASKDGATNNSPVDKCGICIGDKDKGYYDHKTAVVIYDAVDDTLGSAKINESYSNAVAKIVVDANGQLVSFNVDYSISCVIEFAGTSTATGNTHIAYKNFKW